MPSTPWLTPGFVDGEDTTPVQGHPGAFVQFNFAGGHNLVAASGAGFLPNDGLGNFMFRDMPGGYLILSGWNLAQTGLNGVSLMPAFSFIKGIEVRILVSSDSTGTDWIGPADSEMFRVGLTTTADPDGTGGSATDYVKWHYAQGSYSDQQTWDSAALPVNSLGETYTPSSYINNPRYNDILCGWPADEEIENSPWLNTNMHPDGIVGGYGAQAAGPTCPGQVDLPGDYAEPEEPFPIYFGGASSTWGFNFEPVPNVPDQVDRFYYQDDHTLAVRIELVNENHSGKSPVSLEKSLRIHQVALKVHYVENGIGIENTSYNFLNNSDIIKSGEFMMSADWNSAQATPKGASFWSGNNWFITFFFPNEAFWTFSWETGVTTPWSQHNSLYGDVYYSDGYIFPQNSGNILSLGQKWDFDATIQPGDVESNKRPLTFPSTNYFGIEFNYKDIFSNYQPNASDNPSEILSIALNLDVAIEYDENSSTLVRDSSMGFNVYLGGWNDLDMHDIELSDRDRFQTATIPTDIDSEEDPGFPVSLNPMVVAGNKKLNNNPINWMTEPAIHQYLGGPYYFAGVGISDNDPVSSNTSITTEWFNAELDADGLNNRFLPIKIDINGPLLDAIKHRIKTHPNGKIRLIVEDLRRAKHFSPSGTTLYPNYDIDYLTYHTLSLEDRYLAYSSALEYDNVGLPFSALNQAERLRIKLSTSSITFRHTKQDISKQTKKIMGYYDQTSAGDLTPSFNEILDTYGNQMEVLDCKTHGEGEEYLIDFNFLKPLGIEGDPGLGDYDIGPYLGNRDYINFQNSYVSSPNWDEDMNISGIWDTTRGERNGVGQLGDEEFTCYPLPKYNAAASIQRTLTSWDCSPNCPPNTPSDPITGATYYPGVPDKYRATNWSGANFDGTGRWTSGMGNQYTPMLFNEDAGPRKTWLELQYDSFYETNWTTNSDSINKGVHYNALRPGELTSDFEPTDVSNTFEYGGSWLPVNWEQYRTAPNGWIGDETRIWQAPGGFGLLGLNSGDIPLITQSSQNEPSQSSCENNSYNQNTSASTCCGPSSSLDTPGGKGFIWLEYSSYGGSGGGANYHSHAMWGSHPHNNRNNILWSPNIDMRGADPASVYFEFWAYQWSKQSLDRQNYLDVISDPRGMEIGRTTVDVIRMNHLDSTPKYNDGTIHPESPGWRTAPAHLYWDPGTCHMVTAGGVSVGSENILDSPSMTATTCCENPPNGGGGTWQGMGGNSIAGICNNAGHLNYYTGGQIPATEQPYITPGRSLGFTQHMAYDNGTPEGAITWLEPGDGTLYPDSATEPAVPVSIGRIQNGIYGNRGCLSSDPLCQWARVRIPLGEFINADIDSTDNIIRLAIRHQSRAYLGYADSAFNLGGVSLQASGYCGDVFFTKFTLIGNKWDVPDDEGITFSGWKDGENPFKEEEGHEE